MDAAKYATGEMDGSQHEDETEDRPINDTTLPKKKTMVVGPVTGGPLPKQPIPEDASRRRFGLADWNRLLQSSPNLLENHSGLRKIGWSEIRQHNTLHDGWIVLKGKVYNISLYLAYHPGGAAILERVLGKDVTALYNKYHRWVNETGLIGKLQIGYLDTDSDQSRKEDSSGVSYLPQQMSSDGFVIPTRRQKR